MRKIRLFIVLALFASSVPVASQEPCQEITFESSDTLFSANPKKVKKLGRLELKASVLPSAYELEKLKTGELEVLCRLKALKGAKGVRGIGGRFGFVIESSIDSGKPGMVGDVGEVRDTGANGELVWTLNVSPEVLEIAGDPPYRLTFQQDLRFSTKRKVTAVEWWCTLVSSGESACLQ